jgi:hypothetical protein
MLDLRKLCIHRPDSGGTADLEQSDQVHTFRGEERTGGPSFLFAGLGAPNFLTFFLSVKIYLFGLMMKMTLGA